MTFEARKILLGGILGTLYRKDAFLEIPVHKYPHDGPGMVGGLPLSMDFLMAFFAA